MLEKLAENHTLWIKMVVNMGCDKYTAQDIVQSMYLRIHRLVTDEKKIMYNDDEVNRFFIYVTLKNMFIDYVKAKSKYKFFEYMETDESVDDSIDDMEFDEQEAFHNLLDSMSTEIMSWERYDIILSQLYFKTNLSLRDIANGSGISLMSIYNSIKNYKNILNNKFIDDYQDYENGDYHLIKPKSK
jgi:DNA-directed RNA polymerase specialized sigma24 family protein